jgi:hypothetical protein
MASPDIMDAHISVVKFVISAQALTVLTNLALSSERLKYCLLRMEWNKVE